MPGLFAAIGAVACIGRLQLALRLKTHRAAETGSRVHDMALRTTFADYRGSEELERAKGIEPSYAAWEAAVLPLNYARDRRPE